MPCRPVPCQELPEPGRSGENVAHAIASVTRAAGPRTPPRVERSAQLDRGARSAPAPPPRLRRQRVNRYWRYRLAPDPLRRAPKGVAAVLDARAAAVLVVVALGDRGVLCARARQMGLGDRHGADGARLLLAGPGRSAPQYGLDHEFAIDDEEFLPHGRGDRGAVRCRATESTSSTTATSSTRRCSRRSRAAEVVDHDRGVHLLGGRDRHASSPARSPSARAAGVR